MRPDHFLRIFQTFLNIFGVPAKLAVKRIFGACFCILGSGIGGLKTFQEEVTNFVNGDGTPRYNPFFIPKMIPDIAAGVISIRHGFKGPNFATVSACASSANALIDGVNTLG